MSFLALMVLLGLAYLLLPVLSFVRTLQLARDLKTLHRRLDVMERRLWSTAGEAGRASEAGKASEASGAGGAGETARVDSPPPLPTDAITFPRLPEWARDAAPLNVLTASTVANDPNVSNDPNDPTAKRWPSILAALVSPAPAR